MPAYRKTRRNKAKIPCWVCCQGVGKVWVAWVEKHAMPAEGRFAGQWRRVQERRIVRVQRKHPGSAVTAAVLAWRRRGYRQCQRCGAKYITKQTRSKRCAKCKRNWKYNLKHPLGRRQFALKRAAREAAILSAKVKALAEECIAREYGNDLARDGEGGGENA